MLTPEQMKYVGGHQTYPPARPSSPAFGSLHATPDTPSTKAEALAQMGNRERRTLMDEVVDIFTAFHRNGAVDLTVGELAEIYKARTGKAKPPSSFSEPISKLQLSERLRFTTVRASGVGSRSQKAYALVAQQGRLVG